MKRERILCFIARAELEGWLALGWLVVDTLPGPHAYWSVLGEWLCACQVRKLKRRGK